jgi:uncharacterized protein YkwD
MLLALALATSGCGSAGGGAVAPDGGGGTTTAASSGEVDWGFRLLDALNGARAQSGLAPLLLHDAASDAAYEHSWDMDLREFFDHVNPDGEEPVDRLERHGIDRPYAGETLARGYETPEDVVAAWMDSPPHRETILYAGWTHAGVGVHAGPFDGPWWTVNFID